MIVKPSPLQLRIFKGLLFISACLPAFGYLYAAWTHQLGANPVEVLTRASGEWTLRLLLLSLLITPLRKLAQLPWLLRFRRMLGLFVFFYASLHLLTYVWLDQFFDYHGIMRDIIKRPFITIGFAAFILLIPLALTSNQWSIRWLKVRRWQALHHMVYVIAVFGILHFWWLTRADYTWPLFYAVLTLALLGIRLWFWIRNRQQTALKTHSGRFAKG